MLYFNLIHFQENIYVNPNQYYWSCCWRLHVALFAILRVYSIWFDEIENIVNCKSLYLLEYVSFHAMRIFSTIVKHLVLNVIRLSGNKETRDILANTWIGVLIVPIFKKVFKINSEDSVVSIPQSSRNIRSSNQIFTITTKSTKKRNFSNSSSVQSQTQSDRMNKFQYFQFQLKYNSKWSIRIKHKLITIHLLDFKTFKMLQNILEFSFTSSINQYSEY